MKKKVITWHGRKFYLLGRDHKGVCHWIEEGSFDCDWYWGIGYIKTFSNNTRPQLSKDSMSHTHFDTMFLQGNGNAFDRIKSFFAETTFSDEEIWKICELMNAMYTARHYADMLHRGNAHYTENPVSETIKNECEYKRINEKVIPAMLNSLYEIMSK